MHEVMGSIPRTRQKREGKGGGRGRERKTGRGTEEGGSRRSHDRVYLKFFSQSGLMVDAQAAPTLEG